MVLDIGRKENKDSVPREEACCTAINIVGLEKSNMDQPQSAKSN